MRDGGSGDGGGDAAPVRDGAPGDRATDDDTTTAGQDAPASEATGWRARLRRHRLVASGAAVVVLAAAVVVPLTVGGDDPSCWRVPASVRALADDPAAATEALDPGNDLARLPAVKRLLVHEAVCGDGARTLGRVVTAATSAPSPSARHTKAQARGAYAVADVFEYTAPPPGLAPALARVLAEYVVDVVRDYPGISLGDLTGPAMVPKEAVSDDDDGVWMGRFLAPGEAHAMFDYGGGGTGVNLRSAVSQLLTDPEAFAIMYAAERAYLAYYLERLTDEDADPAAHPAHGDRPRDRSPRDLSRIARCIGQLMGYRTELAQDGEITDLDAFDRAIRARTAGVYRPEAHRLDTRPPAGSITDRHVSGPLRGDLTDGRHQMFTVLDSWADQRHTSEQRHRMLREALDSGYVRGLWYASLRH